MNRPPDGPARRLTRPEAHERRITELEKRVTFSSTTIGLLFALPMLALIFVFFYWPSGQALFWAFTLEQPWGGGNRFVGFRNFIQLLEDPVYWGSIGRSLVFGLASTALAMGIALLLALFTTGNCAARGSIAPSSSGPMRSPRRPSASPSASSSRPRQASSR